MRNAAKLLWLLLAASGTTYAQKLPAVQLKGLAAPANIKVDGKITEWGGSLSAYNPTTELYYTLANDADNLYIAASAVGQDMANRIVAGGLSFIINRSGGKNEKDPMVVTFPTYDTPDHKDNYKINRLPKNPVAGFSITSNSNVLKNDIKYIRTDGVQGVDTLISIYNTFNIQAACSFDSLQNLNLEIAIPIKYISKYISGNKFIYRMQVNGGKYREAKNMVVVFADGHTATEDDINKAIAQHNDRQARLSAHTEFSAVYNLAK